MKNRIGTAIVLVSILSCSVSAVCSPGSTYITLNSRSALMQPKFCLYADRYFQEQLDIETIIEDNLYRLGKAYMALSDDTAAQRVFAKLLKHYPDSPHNTEVEHLLGKAVNITNGNRHKYR